MSAEARENYAVLKGNYDTLMDAKVAQDKRIQDLEAQLRDLKGQVAAKPSGNFATQEELKHAADTLKEAVEKVDKARQADNEKVLKSLNEIAKAVRSSAAMPPPSRAAGRSEAPVTEPAAGSRSGRRSGAATVEPVAGATAGQDMLQYEVKENDTPSKIARKLLSEKGIKVTAEQILQANPGVTAINLKVGQKLVIPVPKAPGGATQ